MKKMNSVKKLVAVSLMSMFILSACSSGAKTDQTEKSNTVESETKTSVEVQSKEKVTLRYSTFMVGTHVLAKAEEKLLGRFNELYGDSVDLVVEELPTDTAYTEKMKVLAATNELPNLVGGKNGVRDIAIKNGQAVDLRELFAQDPEFRSQFLDEAIEANTMEDGSIYSLATDSVVVGYYYNKEIFAEVGIKPADTWEEFDSNCEKLLSKGYIPLALMTGENSWTTNILLSAMIAAESKVGLDFMNTRYPETYQTPEVISALTRMQTYLQKYTTPDALGAQYANAANNFEQEQVAMIANGPWMITDFSNPEKSVAGFEQKVAVASFPGGGLVSDYQEGYVVCAETDAEKQAAFELLKVFADAESQKIRLENANTVPCVKLEISDEYKKANPLFSDYIELSNSAKYRFSLFDYMAYPAVVDAFGKYYPELAFGNITPQEMAKKLDEAASKQQ